MSTLILPPIHSTCTVTVYGNHGFISWHHTDKIERTSTPILSLFWKQQHLQKMVVSLSPDVKWKNINTHPSTVSQNLKESHDVCQLMSHRQQMEEHPHPSFHRFTWGWCLWVCQLMSRRQEMEENQHPSFHCFTALVGDGCEFVSWRHTSRNGEASTPILLPINSTWGR